MLFRDFGRIVQIFINFVPFGVPMMYPYAMVRERFGTGTIYDIYLANPMAEAVLLIQRAFWWTTTDSAGRLLRLPARTCWPAGSSCSARCVVLLVIAQWVFTRLEGKVPELLT